MDTEIEHLKSELEKRTLDLQMAAEIGQALVRENQELKEQLRDKDDSTDLLSTKSKLSSLEAIYSDLIAELEHIQQDNEKLTDTLRHNQDAAKMHDEKVQSYRLEVEELHNVVKELESAQAKTKNELAETVSKLVASEANLERTQTQLKDQLGKEAENKEKVQSLLKENEQIGTMNQSLKHENEQSCLKLQELETLLETYQEYRQQAQDQANTIEQMSLEVEFLTDANQKLTAKLSAVGSSGGSSDQGADMGEKSLLHEIEERRLQLIKDHENLAQKHAGLTQSHNLSLYRQQKMKHHIARLSQLTSGDVSQDKIRLLEEELAQCQSEKLELEKRVDALQLKRHAPSNCWDEPAFTADSSGSSDTQRLESLEFRIQQLIEECDSLKKMNQTLRLVKAAESDKLHSTTSALLERERELDSVRRDLANTKFELDELLLGIQEKNVLEGADPALSVKEPQTNSKPMASPTEGPQKIVEVSAAPDESTKENVPPLAKSRKSFDKNARSTFKTIRVDQNQVDQQCKQQ